MSAGGSVTGFVGPLGRQRGLVDRGLGADTLTRWDRWFEIVWRNQPQGTLHPHRPAWRIMARAGLFGAAPLAGCFRLGQDLDGRVRPFALLRLGAVPDPADPWYDAAEALVQSATRGAAGPRELAAALYRLPVPQSLAPALEDAAVLWRDDWEVRVFHCATIAELTAFPAAELAGAAAVEEA